MRSSAATVLAVALGGAVGSLARWGLESVWPPGPWWPWPTLLVNVLGSAALGMLTVLVDRGHWRPWVRSGLGTGLLGGFTTFSAYVVQVHLMAGPVLTQAVPATGVRAVGPVGAIAYLVSTPVLCVGAAALASVLTARWWDHRARPGRRRS